MTDLRVYKFVVLPVVQVHDDDGKVIGERSPQQPETVFGLDGLHRYAEEFEGKLLASVVQEGSNHD